MHLPKEKKKKEKSRAAAGKEEAVAVTARRDGDPDRAERKARRTGAETVSLCAPLPAHFL